MTSVAKQKRSKTNPQKEMVKGSNKLPGGVKRSAPNAGKGAVRDTHLSHGGGVKHGKY